MSFIFAINQSFLLDFRFFSFFFYLVYADIFFNVLHLKKKSCSILRLAFSIVRNDSIPRFTSRQSACFLKGLSRHVAVCISEREWLKCAEGKIGVIPFTRTMPPNPISEMIALNAVLASARRFEGPF